MGETPQRAGIYTRLSYLDDGTEERVDRQEADCRRVADRLAWPISEQHVLSDPGRSAWLRAARRPGWEALLAAIESGDIDAVIVYHGDRLLRQPRDLERLIDIAERRRIRIASVTGTRDLDSPDDRYILRIEAAGFCRASDDSSRRIRRFHQSRAAKGLPRPGGSRAFGFQRDNIHHEPEEVAIIREAVDRLFAGASTYSVMRWMNERCRTTAGNRWRTNVVKGILIRPRLAGLIERDGQLFEAAWEPIIERDVWQDLCVLLEEKARRYSTHVPQVGESSVRYLLSAIARCGTCGGAMNVQVSHGAAGQKRRSYLCANVGCSHRNAVMVPRLDRFVVGAVLELLTDPEFIKSLSSGEDGEGAAQLNALATRKAEVEEQLRSLADHPNLRPELLLEALESFDRRIGEIRAQMMMSARRRLLLTYAGISRERWDELGLEVRRSIVAGLFRIRVEKSLRPGPAFDTERVKLDLVEDD